MSPRVERDANWRGAPADFAEVTTVNPTQFHHAGVLGDFLLTAHEARPWRGGYLSLDVLVAGATTAVADWVASSCRLYKRTHSPTDTGVADRIGITRRTLSQWRGGELRSLPTQANLRAMATDPSTVSPGPRGGAT